MKQALPWIFASILLSAVGQVLLKTAANRIGFLSFGGTLMASLLRLASNPAVLLGTAVYAISMVLWIKALTTAPLGLAYPMVASGYIAVVALSWVIFGEPVTWRQAFGVLAIAVGVVALAGAR